MTRPRTPCAPHEDGLPTAHRPEAHGPVGAPRRRWIKAAGAATVQALAAGSKLGVWGLGAGLAQAAGAADLPAAPARTGNPAVKTRVTGIDQSCVVTASRLDTLVSAGFKDFNVPVVLPGFDAATHGARHDVALHRLVCPFTVPETGEKVTLSGLLAVPAGAKGTLPVLSWQHGTVFTFDGVPSNLMKLQDPSYATRYPQDSLETLFNVHRFAGQGYAVIAADYVGKGPFRQGRAEGYAVKDMTTQACIRMLETGQQAMKSLGLSTGPLFLNGWSQGGLNTMWLHQALRGQGKRIAATATESGFNDLTESFRFWAGAQAFPPPSGMSSYPAMPEWISICMLLALGSYEVNYRIEGLMKAAIRPEFLPVMTRFWADYRLDFDANLPFPSGSNLLVPGFFERHTDERNSAFLRKTAANIATYYRYDSPTRFYFGLADEALHPVMISRALAAGGHQLTGVPVAGGSHRGNFLASLYGDATSLNGQSSVLEWFNSILRRS